MRLIRAIAFLCFIVASASAQTTTTYTGVIRDLSQNVVAAGQVTFELRPGFDSTISGFARFVPSTITCSINQATAGASSAVRAGNSVTISGLTGHTFVTNDIVTVSGMADSTFNGTFTIGSTTATSITYPQTAGNATTGSGVISALRSTPGPGSCTVTMNTALNPSGTSYRICIQPNFISPGSCFNDYAVVASRDITTVVPTPTTSPAYTFVDLHSAQTIDGNKTFTGSTSFTGNLSLGSLSLSSLSVAGTSTLNGGTLNGTYGGNPTLTGNVSVGGTLGVTGLSSLKNLSNIQFASQYSGADWCAKAAAADTALGTKGGQIWVDKSAGTSCAAGFTLHNSLKFIDDADYSARTITIGTGGIKIEGMGLTNVGSTPFGTRLVYVGSAGSDLISIVGSSGSQLDKIGLENLLIDGNNTARYGMLVQWANAGTVKDVRFQGAATANTYFQTSIDWKFYNVGWTFCQGSAGTGYCAIWDGGSGNNHIYGGQTEQGAASTNPQFVFSGSINSFEISGLDFDSCFPFGGFILIQGQDGANSAFAGALTAIGQGRPINLDIHPGFMNYCTGATAAAQGADILVTDASAAQKPTKIHIHDVQMTGGAAPAQVAIKFDQTTDNQVNDIFSTGHTAGTAATVQTTANSSLIRMQNVTSGDTNRFVAAAEVPMDCQQVSASNATWYQCNGGRRLGLGTTALPSLTLSGTGADTGTGWSNPGSTGYWRFSTSSNDDFLLSPTGPILHNGFAYCLANGDSFSSTASTGTAWIAQGVVGSTTNCGTANASGSFKAASFISGGAAAGLTGTGACATFSTQTGGSMAGRATCTGTTGASTLTITPGTTAPTGWVCYVQDQTTRANLLQQTANTATSCTLTATSVTQNDVIVFTAFAF